jgi:preprotein translocase subunit SecG
MLLEFVLVGVHIVVCFVLIMVVLLQSGKAADLAGAFGGGGSQTALGSRGAATVLTKATTIAAVLFMITSLSLALLGSRRSGSVIESAPSPASVPGAPPSGGAPAPSSPGPVEPSAGGKSAQEKGTAPPSGAGEPAPAKSPAPK